jgi:hypothetical protein
MALTVSLLTAGSNSHQESSEKANGLATDIMNAGIIGTTTNTSGVAPTTGGFSANAQGTPDMTVAIGSGTAYVTATPSSQGSQKLRVVNSASANVTISANASGSTKYDWIYISISADNVATLITSRATTPTSDDGTPPTYGTLIAIVTVANGAASITNGNITDKRAGALAGINSASSFFALYNFIESGCVWSGDAYASTKNASMTSGYVWINGSRLTVAAVTARVFTASKDTYVDFKDNLDGTASINYTEVANNIVSPALFGSGTTGNTVRNAIIITGATNILAVASINQGQETMVLPIASSIAYSVTDSLGNLICPRDPSRKLLGYRQIVTAFTTAANNVDTQITGLSVPVVIPSGRKIRIKFYCRGIQMNAGAPNTGAVRIWEGTVGSGVQLSDQAWYLSANGSDFQGNPIEAVRTAPSTSLTYNASIIQPSANTKQITAGSTDPAYVSVELV